MTPGPHTLLATKAGYYDLRKDFNVASDQQEVRVVMEQATGSLELKSDPAGASINLDGTALDVTTPTLIHPTMGHHAITLTKEGFAPYSFEPVVDDSLMHVWSVKLSPARP